MAVAAQGAKVFNGYPPKIVSVMKMVNIEMESEIFAANGAFSFLLRDAL